MKRGKLSRGKVGRVIKEGRERGRETGVRGRKWGGGECLGKGK